MIVFSCQLLISIRVWHTRGHRSVIICGVHTLAVLSPPFSSSDQIKRPYWVTPLPSTTQLMRPKLCIYIPFSVESMLHLHPLHCIGSTYGIMIVGSPSRDGTWFGLVAHGFLDSCLRSPSYLCVCTNNLIGMGFEDASGLISPFLHLAKF